jgi:hypothetical protein
MAGEDPAPQRSPSTNVLTCQYSGKSTQSADWSNGSCWQKSSGLM